MSRSCSLNRKKILSFIENDGSHLAGLRYANSPKMSLLFGVKDVILVMLNKLYSISDQITILSNTSSKFSITQDTYRLFLRYELPDEYRRFKINQIYLRKINTILRLKNSGYSFDKQFLELLPNGLEVDKKPVTVVEPKQVLY